MSRYYVDASALAKRYVDEAGSGWLRALLQSQGSSLALNAERFLEAQGYASASLTFLSADESLNRAAAAEGLAVDNPAQHE